MCNQDRKVDAAHEGYELARYATGEARVEHPESGTCSLWLSAQEEERIKADPAIMPDWALDEDMEEANAERGKGCIEGLKCPSCGQAEGFGIVATTMVQAEEDGAEPNGDLEWDDDSFASCPDCGWSGTVADLEGPSILERCALTPIGEIRIGL